MTMNPSTPGVYIQELPGTPGGIVGVPTSIATFVGATETGPVGTPTPVTSWTEYQSQFGGLAWQAMVPWAVYHFFAEGGSSAYVVRAADTAKASPASLSTGPLTLQAASPGLWGNALHVMVSNSGGSDNPQEGLVFDISVLLDATPGALKGAAYALLQDYVTANNLQVQLLGGMPWYLLEHYHGFTAANLATQVISMVNASSIFVRATVASGAAPQRPPNGGPTPLANGTVPQLDLASATRTLDLLQEVSLLALPDTALATSADGTPSIAAQGSQIQGGLQYCQNRSSVFYVIDPPHGLDVAGVLAFKNGQGTAAQGNPTPLTSAFGALYYPWVFANHPQAGTSVPMPPSGPVLGRYACTDSAVVVFQAPAGVSNGALASVTRLASQVSDAQQEQLNPQGINCLRAFPSYGNVIWGARTLSADPDWTYVSVRRLVIYVEQSLRQGLQWVVFQPDNASTWAHVQAMVNAFLTGLWQQGGLVGPTASQAFFVTCDSSNNPPDDQLAGVLNVTMGLAVSRPAEFIVLQLQQQTATA